MSFTSPAEIVVDYHTDEDGQDMFLGAFLMVPDAETRLLESAHDDEDMRSFVDRVQVLADQMGARFVVAEDVVDDV